MPMFKCVLLNLHPPIESWFGAHLNTEVASVIDVGSISDYVALNGRDDKCIMIWKETLVA